jgi:hypothetical protein
MPNKTVLKPRQEEFDSYPHYPQSVDNSETPASTYIAHSLSSEAEKIVCPPQIAILASDIAKEMRCQAPRSSQTRIARIHRSSGLDTQTFISECYAARSITRNRLGRIQRRNKGQAMPMPYLLKVLENRVNPREKTHQKPLQPLQNLQTKVCSSPPILIDSRPSTEAREAFWQQIHDVTGIGDLRSYCRAANRPPVYDDVRRSIQIVSGRDKR